MSLFGASIRAMYDKRRADKTTDKTRRGGLPAPTQHTVKVSEGDGKPCDGCGETIGLLDDLSTVARVSALGWRFHGSCYTAWVTFRR